MPWEKPGGGILGRWYETLREANFGAQAFYRAVGESDDTVSPVLFNTLTWALVGSITGAAFIAMFTLAGSIFYSFVKMFHVGMATRGAAMSFRYGITLWLATIFIMALWGFVGPWVLGGLHHLALSLFNGVRPDRSFAHTLRAHAYANAAAAIWIVIPPFIGVLVACVFHAKNHIEAYDGIHQCGGGKAFVAWLVSPVMTGCCCCSAVIAIGGLG